MRKFILGGTLTSCLALMAWGYAGHVQAQNQPDILVVQGGTLIDGNGGAPVPNSVIVMQNGRIIAVGRAGQVQVPAGAQMVDASGKWVTPGVIDAKANWDWEYGEALLHWGVTSAMVSGGKSNDIGIAERDAINHGVFAGPRLYEAVINLRGGGVDGKKPDNYKPGDFGKVIHTPDEARQLARDTVAMGADFIAAADGDGPPEVFAAYADEAHKAGKAAVFRAVGPGTRAYAASEAGADVLIHTGNVGVELAKDPDKWKNYIALPPYAYADMDDAKVAPMVKHLVEHRTALEPDLMATARGLHKNWARVIKEDHEFFQDPNLIAYYPRDAIEGLYQNVEPAEEWLTPDQLDRRRRGFANQMKFLKAFVDGGGHLVAASDVPQSPPGLGVLQEMATFQEDAGLTPMQALQAGTKWVADAFRIKDIGTVEVGKYGDLDIVAADPTKDIVNMEKIDTVIQNGKVVDRAYHSYYAGGMFENPDNGAPPVIAAPDWAGSLKRVTANRFFRGGVNFAGEVAPLPAQYDPGNSPTPGIEGVSLHTIIQDSPTQTVAIRGFHFVKRSRVFANGEAIPAKVVNGNEIEATLDQNLLAQAGRIELVVKNPEPLDTPQWGDTSNAASITVPFSFTTVWSHNKY